MAREGHQSEVEPHPTYQEEIMKKLINDPYAFVDEMLDGIVRARYFGPMTAQILADNLKKILP